MTREAKLTKHHTSEAEALQSGAIGNSSVRLKVACYEVASRLGLVARYEINRTPGCVACYEVTLQSEHEVRSKGTRKGRVQERCSRKPIS